MPKRPGATQLDVLQVPVEKSSIMSRLLLFSELIVGLCAAGFLGVWGAIPAKLVLLPLTAAVLCPLFAATAVWPWSVLVQACRDGWGSDPLRRTSPRSVLVWTFIERCAPLSGVVGSALFAVIALGSLSAPTATRTLALAGLCGAEAAVAFLLFRVVRQTVDQLQKWGAAVIPREITDAAVRQFSLSPREREVAALLTQGMLYEEIAARLFISVTTVKTHVHRLYEKTECRNRMELANRLRA